jgi:hypothetical protein
MKAIVLKAAAGIVALATMCGAAQADARAPITLNTPRTFPEIGSKSEWQQRAARIREQILVSCGLWPMPEKTPLNARVFGKIERDGYSIEKVHFQSWPGFYVAGNLYRPLGKGRGPFPGILNPHGHWKEGRLADVQSGSIVARCISFARQGMVAFSYDMPGYNDTFFPGQDAVAAAQFSARHKSFATNRADLLWSMNLMGLQTWNSIRALDFLESLSDVDSTRLACTGASGGGTQTFMLGAIDTRLIAQAPAVMVSHTMQGGCLCENAPGLRIEYSNMEIAAAAAPRPQMLIAATGDWTRATMEIEGPAIQRIYGLFGAEQQFGFARFDFGHNFNQTSREAVYEWFGRWVLEHPEPASLKEAPYTKEADADLRVFPDGKLPADALAEPEFIRAWIRRSQFQLAMLTPTTKGSLEHFNQTMMPAWRHTLQVDWPDSTKRLRVSRLASERDFSAYRIQFTQTDSDETFAAIYFKPAVRKQKSARVQTVVVLADDAEGAAYADEIGNPAGLARALLDKAHSVLVVRKFSTAPHADQFANHFTTYNRTLLQERVRDLVNACRLEASLGFDTHVRQRVVLCGRGPAGLWALLAAPAAHAVIADCNALDWSSDDALLHPDLFCPGLRRLGGFETAAILAAPNPLLLHNVAEHFPHATIRAAYDGVNAGRSFSVRRERLSDDELVKWVSRL